MTPLKALCWHKRCGRARLSQHGLVTAHLTGLGCVMQPDPGTEHSQPRLSTPVPCGLTVEGGRFRLRGCTMIQRVTNPRPKSRPLRTDDGGVMYTCI